jgi:4-amino-4-deoxy-L-arabinose transferase-like glycosyltransferase
MELIVGHNGAARMGSLLRVVGLGRKPSGGPPPGGVPPAGTGSFPPSGQPPDGTGANSPLQEQIPNQAPGQNLPPQADGRNQVRQPTDNTGFRDETGGPGPLRLFNRQLAGQISWFLPLAAICWLAAALQTKVKWPLNRRFQALILWGVWLLPQVVFFSYAGLFHRYYLEMMAPAIAALVGAGLVALYVDYHNPGRRGWLLPTTLLITGGIELIILAQFPEFAPWLAPLILGLTLMVAIALVLLRLLNRQRSFVASSVVAFGLLTLLIAPAIWTMIPVWHGGHAGLPYAGPDLLQERRDGNEVPDMERLIHFLKSKGDEHSYLLATINARQAAPFILITGEPVMALGGFSGGDRILSVEQLESDVLAGKVRFFLLPFEPDARQPAQGGKPAAPRPQADAQNQPPRLQSLQPQAGVPGGNPPPQQRNPQANRQVQLQRWVRGFCKPVPPGLWREPSQGSHNVQGILWDCGSIE